MTRAPNNTLARIELALNEISADQTVFRIVVQLLLMNIFTLDSRGNERFRTIRAQTLGSIDQTLPDHTDPQGAERRKQLTRMRAELLFQEIAEAVGLEISDEDSKDAN